MTTIPASRSLDAVLRSALGEPGGLRVIVGTYAASQPSDRRYSNVTINGQTISVPNLNGVPAGASGAVCYVLADDSRMWVLGAPATTASAGPPGPQGPAGATGPAGAAGAAGATGPAGPINTVADEGTARTVRPTLNFVGAGVTATDDPANTRTNVTIPQPLEAAAWQTWTPTLVFPAGASFGNSAVTARYCQVGKVCYIRLYVNVGSTFNGGTGALAISLPVAARNDATEQVMPAKLYASINATNWVGAAYVLPNNAYFQMLMPLSATNCSMSQMSNSGPQVPATGNYPLTTGSNIVVDGYYETN